MSQSQLRLPGPPRTCCQFTRAVPDGDSVVRDICSVCGHIHYVNPRIVVSAICSWGGRILLCRRAIEPRRGFWTPPGGFLEAGETAEAGALREALEEAEARIAIDRLLAVYDVVHAGQVQLVYRAQLLDGLFNPGPESLETKLFGWDDIPWAELAFPTSKWALTHARLVEGETEFAPFRNPSV
ncbi:MAG TPA: NUDIX hydrolase [Alphaproteobacteria bacterium]|nr:NUDIX hydrolase [Alphaproteobacteria bacterium]